MHKLYQYRSNKRGTSEEALIYALDYTRNEFGAETKMIKLRDLHFKHCEGYYSKNANACIFPCSISEMDKDDQMIVPGCVSVPPHLDWKGLP